MAVSTFIIPPEGHEGNGSTVAWIDKRASPPPYTVNGLAPGTYQFVEEDNYIRIDRVPKQGDV